MRDEDPVIVQEYVPGGYLTSGNGVKFPIPSVITLKHYIKVSTKARQGKGNKRERIYFRDNYTCNYCGTKVGQHHKLLGRVMTMKDINLDHVTPRAQKGTNHPSNLVTACIKCNTRKADRTPEQAHMPLITPIHDKITVGVDVINICKYVEHHPEWLQYLEGREEYDEILADRGLINGYVYSV